MGEKTLASLTVESGSAPSIAQAESEFVRVGRFLKAIWPRSWKRSAKSDKEAADINEYKGNQKQLRWIFGWTIHWHKSMRVLILTSWLQKENGSSKSVRLWLMYLFIYVFMRKIIYVRLSVANWNVRFITVPVSVKGLMRPMARWRLALTDFIGEVFPSVDPLVSSKVL